MNLFSASPRFALDVTTRVYPDAPGVVVYQSWAIQICNNRWGINCTGLDAIPMEERDFFDEKQEKKPATLNCPHCQQSAEYEVTWVVRTKKRQLSGRADERDRARFAKFRSYMVRKDDMLACKNMRCRKRFELTGQSTVITE
jgi:hypothetical protein